MNSNIEDIAIQYENALEKIYIKNKFKRDVAERAANVLASVLEADEKIIIVYGFIFENKSNANELVITDRQLICTDNNLKIDSNKFNYSIIHNCNFQDISAVFYQKKFLDENSLLILSKKRELEYSGLWKKQRLTIIKHLTNSGCKYVESKKDYQAIKKNRLSDNLFGKLSVKCVNKSIFENLNIKTKEWIGDTILNEEKIEAIYVCNIDQLGNYLDFYNGNSSLDSLLVSAPDKSEVLKNLIKPIFLTTNIKYVLLILTNIRVLKFGKGGTIPITSLKGGSNVQAVLTEDIQHATLKKDNIIINTPAEKFAFCNLGTEKAMEALKLIKEKLHIKEDSSIAMKEEKSDDVFVQIEKLSELYKKGILTEEEFNNKKSDLLSKI